MSRLRTIPGWALAVSGALLLVLGVAACEEDGKTAPEKCAEPPLAIYDIQKADPSEGVTTNPCVTPVGHSYSSTTTGGSTASGGTSATAGKSSGGANDLAGAGGA